MYRFFKYPKLIVLIIGLITLFFSWQLINLSLDNDILSFIPEDQPEVLKYYENEEQFGGDRVFAIAIESVSGTIFTEKFIDLILDLTENFQTMKYDVEVSSFANTSYIEGTANGLEVKPMMEDYTGTAADILKLKERLLDFPCIKMKKNMPRNWKNGLKSMLVGLGNIIMEMKRL